MKTGFSRECKRIAARGGSHAKKNQDAEAALPSDHSTATAMSRVEG